MATIAFHRGKDFLFGTLTVIAGQSRLSLKRGETKIIDMPDGVCKITVKALGDRVIVPSLSVRLCSMFR